MIRQALNVAARYTSFDDFAEGREHKANWPWWVAIWVRIAAFIDWRLLLWLHRQWMRIYLK